MIPPLSDNKHIPSLNLLRGIAALSVCCFHILPDGCDNDQLIKSIFRKGYLGLDLFFVISGFIIPYSMYQNNYSIGKFHKFILKRSLRIEPPYIISFLLIICMRIVHVNIHNWQHGQDNWVYTHNWKQFGLHFFYLNQYFGYEAYNVVYWTLAIEFQFYILMGFLFPLILNRNKIAPLILLFIFCNLFWFLDLPYNWFIFQYGFLFLSGILIFLYTIKRISLSDFIILLGIVLTLMYYKNQLEVVLTTIFACASIILIRREWKVTNF